MEKKLNCWEFMRCGHEPGGHNVDKYGLCPSVINQDVDGINGGTNGGRICWAAAGTFCVNRIEGSYAQKLKSCMHCDFYKLVLQEEGKSVFTLKKKE